jgi:hypothetical protein
VVLIVARLDLLELSITCGAFLVALALIFLACSLGVGALSMTSTTSGVSEASAEIVVGSGGTLKGGGESGGVATPAGPQPKNSQSPTQAPSPAPSLASTLQGIKEVSSRAVLECGELLNTSFIALFVVLMACFMLSVLYSMSKPPEEGG